MQEDSPVGHLNTLVSPLQGCGWLATTESCCSLDLFPPGYHHWSSSNLSDVGQVIHASLCWVLRADYDAVAHKIGT